MADRRRHWSLCLASTDLDAFVVMALSHDDGGRRAALGTSAGWDIASACESAIQELLQSEYALELMERAHPETGRPGQSSSPVPRQLAYARHGNILEDLPLPDAPAADERQLRRTASYENLLQSCFDKGLEIWEFDATRQDLNIPCIKLLSSDLCSWEPRFGKKTV
ncbi:YcaO-like family protein [Roseibium salinum]|nr:YcaO-like family protein [Roseibium salinum]